ncbi:hypothetical protein GOP47_0022642 [Adiantum capillus-veneris]|uniref:Glycosyltransferase subfamily 4-like N-terminal domain-containing protein n=1 Tax=Adiantum capillus-veneris TaxID=13818 RepID=A0A9D4U6W0_ADICA|nr:hypothetical protein GOP47_0022642 [Adiantum capillus-veneris]
MGKRNRAAVVVLGDLGRSPRMQYHALSLASQVGLEVDVIAYSGSEPHPDLLHNPQIHLHLMHPPGFQGLPRILYLVVLPLKLLQQLSTLVWVLFFRISAPDFFIIQNPPSIPTFTVVGWACWLRKSAVIIDWHNFGYTLLGMSLGTRHPLVKMYSWYERKFGKSGHGHICVTKAMQQELAQNWGIQATVLYDRAPGHFHPTSIKERHELFLRLGLHHIKGHSGLVESAVSDDHVNSTLFTSSSPYSESDIQRSDPIKVMLKRNRPALIISSTSWTADEDFNKLLEAAVLYDRRVNALLGEDYLIGIDSEAIIANDPFPSIHIIVTGKGPLKEEYEKKMQKLRLNVGSADLGVCLHTSSSGLDLPMKVVDMFGCGLPVCAVSYSCINELVRDGENGLLFETSSQLANQFLELFKGFPLNCKLLSELQRGAVASGSSSRWGDEWAQKVLPLVRKLDERDHA